MSKFHRISEYCEVYDGPHATPKETDKGPVYLGIKAITEQGRIDSSQFKYLSDEDYVKWTKRVTPEANDIVFSYEATLGRYAIIPEGFNGCLGRRLAIVRVKDTNKLNYKYLYYYFLSPAWKAFINNHTVSGSTVDRISIDEFPNYEIQVPEIEMQNKIVKILDSIDTRIEINLKTINVLESMAKTLYDYWFVQFDFPDANGRPYKTSGGKMVWNEELGRKIPAGWEVSPLSELASYSIERISSSELTCQNYIGMDNMIANRGGVKESNYAPPDGDMVRFEENDILLGNIRPYFKKIWLAGYDGGCNPDVLAIKANEAGMAEFLYATLSQDAFFDYDTAGAKGTKMPRGDKNHIMSYPVPWNMKLAMRFSEQVRLGYRIKNKLTVENNTLTSLRDFLLPMLMNGQVTFRS